VRNFAGEGRIVLASSGENQQAREINNCDHISSMPPHTHGIFSYHLIKGLEGEAADEFGYVTLGNLQKYIEANMHDINQKTKFVAEGGSQSRIENIKIAIASDKYTQTIKDIIEDIRSQIDTDGGIDSFKLASIKLDKLIKIEPKNPKVDEFTKSINTVLQKYNDPVEDWLSDNSAVLRPQIENGFPGLYPRLFELERYLSFDGLHRISELDSCLFSAIYDVINGLSEIDTFVWRCRACAKRFHYAAK